MRPVNLLPASARPYQASGGKSTTTYAFLGVLALLVLGLAIYVTTSNKIATSKDQIAKAQAEQAQAEAKAAGLQAYGTYSQVADTRIATVATLAIGRIDYERLMRETAKVLPAGVWLTSVDAEAGTGSPGSSTTTTASGTSSGGPTVHLLGCAKTQNDVATTIVRLRAIHGSDEVDLNSSSQPLKTAGTTVTDSAGASGGCGSNYSFDILVDLSTAKINGSGDIGQKVPVALGGGS
jgi:Tfp pilus assembly protein PilN